MGSPQEGMSQVHKLFWYQICWEWLPFSVGFLVFSHGTTVISCCFHWVPWHLPCTSASLQPHSLWILWFPIKHLPRVHWGLPDAKASTWSVVEWLVKGLIPHSVICHYQSHRHARDIISSKFLVKRFFSVYLRLLFPHSLRTHRLGWGEVKQQPLRWFPNCSSHPVTTALWVDRIYLVPPFLKISSPPACSFTSCENKTSLFFLHIIKFIYSKYIIKWL